MLGYSNIMVKLSIFEIFFLIAVVSGLKARLDEDDRDTLSLIGLDVDLTSVDNFDFNEYKHATKIKLKFGDEGQVDREYYDSDGEDYQGKEEYQAEYRKISNVYINEKRFLRLVTEIIPRVRSVFLYNFSGSLNTAMFKRTNIARVTFIHSNINTIQPNLFEKSKVEMFKILESSVNKVHPGAFNGTQHLTQLSLQNTNLEINSSLFKDLGKLKKLTIAHCNLNNIDDNLLQGMRDLSSLKMDHNNITSLPENFLKKNRNLKMLSLKGNKLTELPCKLFYFQHQLASLILTNNNLSRLPCNIIMRQYDSLTYFDIAENNKIPNRYRRIFTHKRGVFHMIFEKILAHGYNVANEDADGLHVCEPCKLPSDKEPITIIDNQNNIFNFAVNSLPPKLTIKQKMAETLIKDEQLLSNVSIERNLQPSDKNLSKEEKSQIKADKISQRQNILKGKRASNRAERRRIKMKNQESNNNNTKKPIKNSNNQLDVRMRPGIDLGDYESLFTDLDETKYISIEQQIQHAENLLSNIPDISGKSFSAESSTSVPNNVQIKSLKESLLELIEQYKASQNLRKLMLSGTRNNFNRNGMANDVQLEKVEVVPKVGVRPLSARYNEYYTPSFNNRNNKNEVPIPNRLGPASNFKRKKQLFMDKRKMDKKQEILNDQKKKIIELFGER